MVPRLGFVGWRTVQLKGTKHMLGTVLLTVAWLNSGDVFILFEPRVSMHRAGSQLRGAG